MSKTTIFVTGASGNIGSETAKNLDKNKFHIKLGVRDTSKVEHIRDLGHEIIPIDFSKKETLLKAFKGTDRILIVPPASQDRGHLVLNAIQACKEIGVQFVALFSVIGASEEKRNSFQKQLAQAEEVLRSSGLSWCIFQSPYFQENVLSTKDTLELPLRDGSVPFVSIFDIGRTIAQVLSNPGPHSGKVYRLTGPQAETGESICKALSQVQGRNIQYKNVEPKEFVKRLQECGLPHWQADGVAELVEDYASKRVSVSNSIQQLTGKPPRSIEQTARAAFGGQAYYRPYPSI
jgi:uncharacterized protein YbjT (DUF2867 family)